MKSNSKTHNDFIIDRLTNSIRNCISSDSLPTEVLLLSKEDLGQLQRIKGWLFNWKNEHSLPD